MRADHAACLQQMQVLQVALTPAPVALHLLEQRRRRLLVAAGKVEGQPQLPAGASEQRRFDEVVAEDLAAERRLAGQSRQGAVLHERRDANDRVVPPVLTVAELPVVQAGGEHRPVDAAGELLGAARTASADRPKPARSGSRRRAGAAPSCCTSADERRARHDAVGVEHDHVAVLARPSAGRSRRRCRSCARGARGGADRRCDRSRRPCGTSRTTPPLPSPTGRGRRCR